MLYWLYTDRGENGPGGYKLVSVDDKNTLFVWLCDTDLKVCDYLTCCHGDVNMCVVRVGYHSTLSTKLLLPCQYKHIKNLESTLRV